MTGNRTYDTYVYNINMKYNDFIYCTLQVKSKFQQFVKLENECTPERESNPLPSYLSTDISLLLIYFLNWLSNKVFRHLLS